MNKFLYKKENVINDYICHHIIKLFEYDDKLHYYGTTGGKIRRDIRNTITMNIPKNTHNWCYIEKMIHHVVNKHFDIYMKTVNEKDYKGNEFILYDYIIQKNEKNKGFYHSHNDFMISKKDNTYRYATIIIYLNTLTEGGNTIFWDEYKEQPVAGKLIIFPSNWTFQHEGEMPISNDKYIITAWICCRANNRLL